VTYTKLLGVGTVAMGFAFQNILQDFLAECCFRNPLELGDFISVTGILGRADDSHERGS
jgi:small-conductance mechanosensitive channel